jgi:hypothetical protein
MDETNHGAPHRSTPRISIGTVAVVGHDCTMQSAEDAPFAFFPAGVPLAVLLGTGWMEFGQGTRWCFKGNS